MQNKNLIDSFMSSEAYNNLPHIDNVRDAPERNADALQALLRLIRQHGYEDKFSVHLIHKHFDAPDGCVMVCETKTGVEHPTFMVFGPRKQQDAQKVRGLFLDALCARAGTVAILTGKSTFHARTSSFYRSV